MTLKPELGMKEIAYELKAIGLSYMQVAIELGVSRQRVHQLMSPTDEERQSLLEACKYKCQRWWC